MNLLEVKNISKTYGTGEATVHALKQATFSVPKGEFVAIVGESGSGCILPRPAATEALSQRPPGPDSAAT